MWGVRGKADSELSAPFGCVCKTAPKYSVFKLSLLSFIFNSLRLFSQRIWGGPGLSTMGCGAVGHMSAVVASLGEQS